jgi:hypothetical protein
MQQLPVCNVIWYVSFNHELRDQSFSESKGFCSKSSTAIFIFDYSLAYNIYLYIYLYIYMDVCGTAWAKSVHELRSVWAFFVFLKLEVICGSSTAVITFDSGTILRVVQLHQNLCRSVVPSIAYYTLKQPCPFVIGMWLILESVTSLLHNMGTT